MAAWVIGAAALVLGAGVQDGSAARTNGMPMAMPPMGDAAPCPATPAPLPATYAGWTAMAPLTAGTAADAAPMLALGSSARLALADAASVRFAAAPGHAPAAGSKGGIVAVTIPATGRYRVALGAGAWIDLVQGTTALRSVAHGHGPACTTLKKVVDFDLQPGRYLLQLSGNAAPTLAMMVTRVAG